MEAISVAIKHKGVTNMKSIFKVSNIPEKRTKKGSLKVIMPLIFLIAIFQVLACQSFIQTDSRKPIPENLQINTSQKNVEERQLNNSRSIDLDLERNRRLWDEKKIIDYNITVSAGQGGNVIPADSVLIEVRDGKGTLIEPTPKVDKMRLEIYENYDTFDKMFDAIQQGLEEGAKVDVKYNKTFGYPEDITVDDLKRGIHSWIIIKIKKFEVVK